MKNFILYTVKLLLVGFLLLYLLAEFSFWSLRQGNFYKPSFINNTLQKEQLDYIVLGASTALTGIDTKQLDKITGLCGVNLAIDDTGLPNHYLMLKHYLALSNQTKKVILVPTVNSLETEFPQLGNNDYRFLMFGKKNYVRSYYSNFEEGSEWPILSTTAYLPFLGWSYYNTELFFPSLLSFIKPEKRNRFDSMGNYTYPDNNFKLPYSKPILDTVYPLNPYYTKIKALCEQEKIALFVFIPPHYNENFFFKDNVKVINFSDFLRDANMFYDPMHVNKVGRKKVTSALAEYLMQ